MDCSNPQEENGFGPRLKGTSLCTGAASEEMEVEEERPRRASVYFSISGISLQTQAKQDG